ncbi:UNVERIFIED_CONTAM: hypothetical protein HDU68_000567 [Siphonaria sp. JEL0065]|nr:hypothetical protein HDU68_000567 [Siphonaria sp. JEL0065]
MKFQTQIVIRLILPIIIGFILIGFSAILVFFLRVPPQINSLQAELQSNEIDHFSSNAKGAASLVNNIFIDFGDQIEASAVMARDLLRLDGATLDPFVNSTSTYPSYFAGQLDNSDPPLPQNPLDYSAYYRNNISTLAQFKAIQPDITSVLDNIFRASVVYEPRIRGIQMGFADGGWRIYPQVYNLASFNPRNNTFCNGQNVPAELRGSTGFNPRCRQFYIAATTAYPLSQPAPPTGMTKPVFTNPYPAAVSGQLLVSASVSLYKSGSFYGVIALQILIESLASKLANTPILNNGYIYIIDKDGTVIMYPKTKTNVNIYNADMTTPLAAVEFNNNTALFSSFLTQIKAITDKGVTGTYTKDNGQVWTFAAATVAATSHILVVTAPNSDIDALADTMRRSYVSLLSVSLTATILTTLLAAFISYRIANGLALKIMRPINDMVKRLGEIADNKLDFEFENKPLLSKELNNVNDNFKNLLTAVRFGNKAYYADNLHVALENYLSAEALMIRLGNLRGEGVCANNLGNVYRMLEGEFPKAVSSYNRAVDIATVMLESAPNTLETQTALRTILANRLNNMGVLFKENLFNGVLSIQDAATAESFFEKSLVLHRQTDNLEGIAQVSGNLGQLYLTQSKIDKAATLITDAFYLVRQRNDNPIAFQYACLNMGLLCEAQKKFSEAVTWYLYVLQRFKVVVKFVQKMVVQRLISLCEETDPAKGVNRPALAKSLKKLAEPLFGTDGAERATSSSTKNITFVLDVSGSMAGGFIRTCRQSIKDIINDNCSPSDNLTLIKFDHRFSEVFANHMKKLPGHMESMMSSIDNRTEAEGGTAFYDAVSFALGKVAASSNSLGDKWVIALTDGDDFSPNKVLSLRKIKQILQENRNVGVIVITVGALKNEGEIRAMLVDVNNKKGLLIRSEANSGGIKDAFGKAVRMMQGGDVNVESL